MASLTPPSYACHHTVQGAAEQAECALENFIAAEQLGGDTQREPEPLPLHVLWFPILITVNLKMSDQNIQGAGDVAQWQGAYQASTRS